MTPSPPRNGEGDHGALRHGGGAGAVASEAVRPHHHPAAPGGPPPRSGEEKKRRVRHRTLGAPAATVELARRLRKDMSPAERRLWRVLRERPGGFRFRKQCPQGPYSLDFACIEARLAIEVDGASHDYGERPARDERLDLHLREVGFATMRIPARELLDNLEGVVLGIVEECRRLRPHHHPAAPDGPPPRSGEEM